MTTPADIIHDAKAKRRRQMLLDQALGECCHEIFQFHLSERKKELARYRDEFSMFDPDVFLQADTSKRQREQDMVERQSASVRALLDQGADINARVVMVDRHGEPTHITTPVNFLLQVQSYTFYPLAVELAEKGARLDQETALFIAKHASSHCWVARENKEQPTTPEWFTKLADRLMEVPGLHWDLPIADEAMSSNPYMHFYEGQQEDTILMVHAVERYYPGFIGRLRQAQEARGEPPFAMHIPVDITPQQASQRLRELITGKDPCPVEDRFAMVQQLLGAGADPHWCPAGEHARSAMDTALWHMNVPLVKRLLSHGAGAQAARVDRLIASALEDARGNRHSPGVDQEKRNHATIERVLAVMHVLQAHGASLDLAQPVTWDDADLMVMDTVRRTLPMEQALEERLPGFLEPFRAMQQAHALETTIDPVQNHGRRARL